MNLEYILRNIQTDPGNLHDQIQAIVRLGDQRIEDALPDAASRLAVEAIVRHCVWRHSAPVDRDKRIPVRSM